MIKGAIFDLDGTILDSMFIWDTIGEDYLRSLGIEPKENLKETFKTFTLEQAAEYYRENYGVTLSVDEIIDGVNKMVERYYAETVKLKPGIEVFLEKLKAKGVKMCIANSNYEGVNVEVMRCKNGEIMARDEALNGEIPDVDYVAGVPDSGVPHAIGYSNAAGKPFARPFIKYTPTWARSFTPSNQEMRNLIAEMKQIPVPERIKDKKLLSWTIRL